MSVLGLERAKERSRVNGEDDKITWLDTEAKEESSLPVCKFILKSCCITDTWFQQWNK